MRCSSRRSFSDDGEWLDSNLSVSCGSLGSDQAARRVHGPRVQSRMDFSRPRDAPRRAARLSPDRGGRTARDALDAIHDCDDVVHRRLDVAALLHGAVSEMVAAQPAAPAERAAGSRLKHRRFFHDQHQLAGLAYHIFASAAVGIVLTIAVVRGIARHETDTLGNFWVDMTRCFLWVELPVCLVGSLFLVSQGVIQNLKPYTTVQLVEPQTVQTTGPDKKPMTQVVREQVIAQGPTASQEVIKEFGTNGGGFFNAKS